MRIEMATAAPAAGRPDDYVTNDQVEAMEVGQRIVVVRSRADSR